MGGRRWSDAEIANVLDNFSQIPTATLAAQLGRSYHAVACKAWSLGCQRRSDGYTARSLAEALGVSHVTVGRWIARGWLQATCRQEGEHPTSAGWLITREAFRQFAARHAREVAQGDGRLFWAIDVLVGVADDGARREVRE